MTAPGFTSITLPRISRAANSVAVLEADTTTTSSTVGMHRLMVATQLPIEHAIYDFSKSKHQFLVEL
jgi:hypothetical protein